MKKITLIGFSILLLFSSCATILRTKKHYTFDSYPQGASAYADKKYVGKTPCSYDSRKKIKNVTFASGQYGSITEKEEQTFSYSSLWNIYPGCVILGTGFIVDAISGSLTHNKYTDFFYDFEKRQGTLAHAQQVKSDYQRKLQEEAAKAKEAERTESARVAERNRLAAIEAAKAKEQSPNASTLSKIRTARNEKSLSSEQIFKKYNSAVFMIYTSDGNNAFQGSGFFVSSDGIAISNYHVFEGTNKGKEVIKTIDNQTYKVDEVLGYSKIHDYIIFKVRGNGFNYIPITDRGFSVGEKVYALGSPQGEENTFSDGMVTKDRGDFTIQISVPIDHGSSGGVLINKYGEAIGITAGCINVTSVANLNYAIDIRAIYSKVPTGQY